MAFIFIAQTIFISLPHHSPSYLALFPFRLWVPWGKDWVCAQPLPSAHQHGPRLKVSRHYHKLSENQDWQEIATGHKGPNQLLSVPPVNVCSFTLFLHFFSASLPGRGMPPGMPPEQPLVGVNSCRLAGRPPALQDMSGYLPLSYTGLACKI